MSRSFLFSSAILLSPLVLLVGLFLIFFSEFIFVGVICTCFGAISMCLINRHDEKGVILFTLIAAGSVTVFYGAMIWFQLAKNGVFDALSRSVNTTIDLTASCVVYFLLLYYLWVVATRAIRKGNCEQSDRSALKQYRSRSTESKINRVRVNLGVKTDRRLG